MRQPQVTRTMTITTATVLCLDILEEKPTKKDFVLPRTYKKDVEIIKKVTKLLEGTQLKAVHVVSIKVEKGVLFGMTEDEYLKSAVRLDHRVSKIN